MNKVSTAYILWCFFFLPGLHRFYNGKIASGLLWFCTGGLLGIGQFIDLFLIPNMVEEHNILYQARHGLSPAGVPLQPAIVAERVVKPTRDQLMVKLTQAAAKRGGKLSVTQAVMDTEITFAEAESTLKEMLKTGYVAIENDPQTGVVVYEFREL
ncbi:MAG: NINE protein [Leptolyngbyaceae bacterium]|nr:NINE protein [Leptolyngbyaceae bacterium]